MYDPSLYTVNYNLANSCVTANAHSTSCGG